MKRIKHYLEETIVQMLFNAIAAFWEQPFPKKKFREEMHTLLKSVEQKLNDQIEEDERFFDEE